MEYSLKDGGSKLMSNLTHTIRYDVGFYVTANVHGPVENQIQKSVRGKVTLKLDSELLYLWSEIFLQEIRLGGRIFTHIQSWN